LSLLPWQALVFVGRMFSRNSKYMSNLLVNIKGALKLEPMPVFPQLLLVGCDDHLPVVDMEELYPFHVLHIVFQFVINILGNSFVVAQRKGFTVPDEDQIRNASGIRLCFHSWLHCWQALENFSRTQIPVPKARRSQRNGAGSGSEDGAPACSVTPTPDPSAMSVLSAIKLNRPL